MKKSKAEIITEINESEMSDELKIQLMEDITDSFEVENDNSEYEDLKTKYEDLKAKHDELVEKYKSRFVDGTEEKKDDSEEKEDSEELEEKEVIDVKEI